MISSCNKEGREKSQESNSLRFVPSWTQFRFRKPKSPVSERFFSGVILFASRRNRSIRDERAQSSRARATKDLWEGKRSEDIVQYCKVSPNKLRWCVWSVWSHVSLSGVTLKSTELRTLKVFLKKEFNYSRACCISSHFKDIEARLPPLVVLIFIHGVDWKRRKQTERR